MESKELWLSPSLVRMKLKIPQASDYSINWLTQSLDSDARAYNFPFIHKSSK